MKSPRTAAILFFLAAGCSGIPFKEAPKVPVDGTDPRAVVDRFASRIPGRFSLLVSLVFDYSMIRRMSALGTVEGDTARDRFTAAVVNQMGVKILELESAISERLTHIGNIDKPVTLPSAKPDDVAEETGIVGLD